MPFSDLVTFAHLERAFSGDEPVILRELVPTLAHWEAVEALLDRAAVEVEPGNAPDWLFRAALAFIRIPVPCRCDECRCTGVMRRQFTHRRIWGGSP